MGKIKIGLIILGSIALVGLVVAGVVTAKNGSEKGKAEFVQNEIIVKFKGDVKPFRVIKVPEGKVWEEIGKYKKRADVIYAEPNYIAYTQMVPNDPYYKYQWHLDNPEYGGINMEAAWDITTGANSVIVAIVDTGIAYEDYKEGWKQYCQAPDLAQTCFVAGYDFVNGDTHPNDDHRHGTHVAGTVAQSTNNNLGVAGVAFNTCLMPVKVLDSRGSGTYADVAAGIRYAAGDPAYGGSAENKADVINLSLGGSATSTALEEAVAYAYINGVTVVAAAGNDGEGGAPSYPAAYNDYVIAVGATQYDENRAPYSTTGSYLDLVAPGGNNDLDQNDDGYADGVLQQTFKNSWRVCDFAYYFFQGTSMATPHVSGVAALLIAKGNTTAPDEVRAALQETAECLPPGGTCPNDTYGYGLVDAYAALGWTAAPACTTDADCDDGLYCNGAETCVAGVCQAGTPPCDDGVACTIDSCDEATQSCTYTPDDTACAADGWFDTGNTRWVEDTECTEKEQKEQEYRDYYCDPVLDCQYTVTATQWVDTGATRNVTDNTPCTDGVCCSGVCEVGLTECPTAVMCWSGDYQYLYWNNSQAKKFCKCAQGTYGYNSYNYEWVRATVWKYVDTGDNENWEVTSRSSNLPVYQVTCTDGTAYPTNQDYYYPK